MQWAGTKPLAPSSPRKHSIGSEPGQVHHRTALRPTPPAPVGVGPPCRPHAHHTFRGGRHEEQVEVLLGREEVWDGAVEGDGVAGAPRDAARLCSVKGQGEGR